MGRREPQPLDAPPRHRSPNAPAARCAAHRPPLPKPALCDARAETVRTPGYAGRLSSVADQPLHRALGLSDWEFGRIRELLGRAPNDFELAVFSLLWSEHCGYKHSAPLLRRLPQRSPRVLQGPGENAGVVDLGGGIAVAFKAESHNHPSAVEPFQGAATGVGGILRDVVAMGARPIALLDALRFGEPDWHFRRAVAGIGHYGNCVGVPTVGGECAFDEAYARNPLVNAMCVGLLPTERVLTAKARGAGNAVVLYGALTGRDGIGGASVLASQDLDGSGEKRPSVQIGDPFRGKALIEVSLELVERDLVVSLQDCGAAGLASSLSEMARDGTGVDVHLDRVPLREPDLEPWEVMISESQERMVAVVARDRVDDVRAVCARWELPCTVVGEVAEHGELRAWWDDELVGSIPAALLTDECPRYALDPAPRPVAAAPVAAVNNEPKNWVFEQYDHLVGSRTVRRPGLDAAVLRVEGTRGIAVSLDGPRLGERDPLAAGWGAVMEAALNVACVGGEPLALTDCLNFGNPEKPTVAWELEQAVEGIAAAAAELGIPVVSGNVSLYNETGGRSIPPTPVVGCVGLVRDLRRVPTGWRSGDTVWLLRGRGARLVEFVWRNAHRFSLAHDVSDGGVELALREAATWSGRELAPTGSQPDAEGVVVAGAQAPEWRDAVELGTVA
ncbi:MAG TPA: phosphoribosylformylglycinamidine synthase subunit PurL [Gaiellaceae bacterium]|nr:phosphoribosylformylglycinamidine synthase subunit PurL [Gaiellaceae bacterium]